MSNPTDVTVVICTHMTGIARTLRMAVRGMGVRNVGLANDTAQLVADFAATEPACVILYVDSADPADPGLQALHFIRKSEDSPNAHIPVIAVSLSRDLETVNAVINGGGHEYVLFPTSGEVLLKKITAARTTARPWIDRPDYFGPERRVDREAQPAVESLPESDAGDAAEAGEKTAG